MSILRRIEKTLDERLRGIFGRSGTEPGSSEAIELYREALDQIAARATVGVRGDRVFPFDRIRIELKADTPERRSMLDALFAPDPMAGDVRATLVEAGVSIPATLAIAIDYPENPAVELRVLCEKAAAAPVPASTARPLVPMRLVTLTGASSVPDFLMDRAHISIGRVDEVPDSLGRAIRRNDLFFPEADAEANASVSRAHAHIRFDASTGEWRIYDDGSSLGTSIFREGRRIDVPAHASRGVMLRVGDEIYLGQVRLRFTPPAS
jgi:FHA domain